MLTNQSNLGNVTFIKLCELLEFPGKKGQLSSVAGLGSYWENNSWLSLDNCCKTEAI